MEAKLNLYHTLICIYLYFERCMKKRSRKVFDFKWSASLTDRYQLYIVMCILMTLIKTGLGRCWNTDLLFLFNQLGNINRSWKLQQIQAQQLQVCLSSDNLSGII